MDIDDRFIMKYSVRPHEIVEHDVGFNHSVFYRYRRQHEPFLERKLERSTERVRTGHRRRVRYDHEKYVGIGIRSGAVRVYFSYQLTR